MAFVIRDACRDAYVRVLLRERLDGKKSEIE